MSSLIIIMLSFGVTRVLLKKIHNILTAHDVVQYPMIQSVSKIAKHLDYRFRQERRVSHSMAPKHLQSRAKPSNKK